MGPVHYGIGIRKDLVTISTHEYRGLTARALVRLELVRMRMRGDSPSSGPANQAIPRVAISKGEATSDLARREIYKRVYLRRVLAKGELTSSRRAE